MDLKQMIGLRIKDIRIKKGFTQEQLAEKININSKYLSSIERGRENPTLNILIKLSESLDVNFNDIFYQIEIEDSAKRKSMINSILKEEDLDSDPGIADLLKAVRRVLKSGNQVASDALEHNIRYFDYAIKTEKRLKIIENEQATLKDMLAEMKKRFEKEKYPERKVAVGGR